ncbi:hypothetical protein SK128_026420, partial [Halocaridina rubra]
VEKLRIVYPGNGVGVGKGLTGRVLGYGVGILDRKWILGWVSGKFWISFEDMCVWPMDI